MGDEVATPAPWLTWIWRAWHRLHQDRPLHGGGMSAPVPGAIAWRDIVLWHDRHGGGLEMLEFGISQMDIEFIDWHRTQREKS